MIKRIQRLRPVAHIAIRALFKIVFLVIISLLLTWFLEYRYYMGSGGADEVWKFITSRTLVFLWSALILGTMLLILYGIVGRPFLTVSIASATILIITYIHLEKIALRGAPLLPEDFQLADQAGNLMNFVDVFSIIGLIISVIIIIAVGLILDHFVLPFWRVDSKSCEGDKSLASSKISRLLNNPKGKLILSRLIIVVIGCCGFIATTSFIRNRNGQNYDDVEWLRTQLVAWNQVENYDLNGFLIGFLYNCGKRDLSEPEGYSDSAISDLKNIYQSKKDDDTERTPLKDLDTNIVIILGESFGDPSLTDEYYRYTGGDITPNMHAIQRKYPSGYMYSPEYGGGTANIEFEIISQLSGYWANTVPYTDLVPVLGGITSVANFTKSVADYSTSFIHPYSGNMYKRNLVKPIEGFDDFIDIDDFKNAAHDGNSIYINDLSSYEKVLEVLKESDEKQLVELVTMQNHVPYNSDTYDSYQFSVPDIDNESERKDLEVYLQTLHNADEYLGRFIKELDTLDERTVVLFYGDHSTGLFPRVYWSEDDSVSNLAHLTPYFIYTNFDAVVNAKNDHNGLVDFKYADATWNNLPTTTPNCLTNTLYNVLNLEKPVISYVLDDVCAETPILSSAYLRDQNPSDTSALRAYRLINYDILSGKQYWLK